MARCSGAPWCGPRPRSRGRVLFGFNRFRMLDDRGGDLTLSRQAHTEHHRSRRVRTGSARGRGAGFHTGSQCTSTVPTLYWCTMASTSLRGWWMRCKGGLRRAGHSVHRPCLQGHPPRMHRCLEPVRLRGGLLIRWAITSWSRASRCPYTTPERRSDIIYPIPPPSQRAHVPS
jgi:hypothetical protein